MNMSKINKGLTVDRAVGSPILHSHPVSQKGYYYPENHKDSFTSIEVQNHHRKKQELLTTLPSATPKPSKISQNKPTIQSNSLNSRENPRYITNSNLHSNSHNINTYYAHSNANQISKHSNSSAFLTPQPHLSDDSRSPSLQNQMPSQNNSSLQKVQNSKNLQRDPFIDVPPGHREQLQRQQQYYYLPEDKNKAKETPIVNDNNSQHLNLPDPVLVEDYISQAIKYHENDQLEKSTEYLRIAAEKGSAVGKVLYGIALRHGWGCKVNEALAFSYLRQAAESAINILDGINKSVSMRSMRSFRGEIVLAIYELGICFRHGWGILKSKATAAHYFEIAANMGDPDAQNDIAYCYHKGEGVKKDLKKAAKYYRMADEQGHGIMGNSWIYKDKYNDKK